MEEIYNDGFTMEEQAEFRRIKKESTIKLKLTERFQAESADRLIKSLRVKLGESESYIQELEEELSKTKNELDKFKHTVKGILNKYSDDVKELKKDPFIDKYKQEITSLEEQNKKLIDTRDKLLYKLSQYEKLSKSDQ